MNEYSFLVCEPGRWVLAITSPQLDYQALHRAISIDASGAYLPFAFANHDAMGLNPIHAAPAHVIFNPPAEL